MHIVIRRTVSLAVLLILVSLPASASLQVLDAYYRPDRALPEFNYLWNSGFRPGSDPPNYILSGELCVYLRNTGSSALAVNDVLLQNISLIQAFGCKTGKTYRSGLAYACSIHIPGANPITTTQRQTLIDAGEPIWWRVDPDTLAPGEAAEILVRMRVRRPQTLSLTIQSSDGASIPLSITVSDTDVPRVAGYAPSPDLDRLYLYFRHAQKGKTPVQIVLDGQDITGDSSIGSDSGVDVTPVVCNLPVPLVQGSFHCFQALYDDGSKASAGARVFYGELQYGLWGGNNASTLEEARAHVENMGRHNINMQFQGATGMVNTFMKSPEGLALMDQLGMLRTNSDPDKAFGRLYAIFLCDEPDAGDAAVPSTAVPSYAQLGSLAESLVTRGDSFRPTHPTTPNILNVDSTFKPHNWYTYGQIADIFAADPYYQVRLADSYWNRPYQVPIYTKATYIYAVSSVCEAACEPKPLHIILNCTRKQDGTKIFRFATPEEKRIEAYYALAGGAKQFSYWWFTPTNPTSATSHGCGANEPDAAALWREMGLIGAEIRTVGPVIVRSCPAEVPVTAPGELWVRSLISGLDTMVLLCVNDDYANDRAGTIISPVEDAQVNVNVPSWLNPGSVFEVDYKGIHDLSYTRNGQELSLQLGKVNVTRLVVITSNSSLRNTLQSLHSTRFASNVSQIVPIPQGGAR